MPSKLMLLMLLFAGNSTACVIFVLQMIIVHCFIHENIIGHDLGKFRSTKKSEFLCLFCKKKTLC